MTLQAQPSGYIAPTRIQNIARSWDDFDALPVDVQAEAWTQLAHEAKQRTDGIAHYEGTIDVPLPLPPKPKRTWTPRPVDPGSKLDEIETSDYVQALAGIEVDYRRNACCPFPDHEDSGPSFKAYDNGSFMCFGCGRGGAIFQFAAALWGIPGPLRGDTFRDVRDRLLDELGLDRRSEIK